MQNFDVHVSSDGIKLGQFLKLANLVATGGEAKTAIAGENVRVNDAVTTQRGFTLHDGDVVCLGDTCATVVVGDSDDDYFDEATANDDFDPEKWRNL